MRVYGPPPARGGAQLEGGRCWNRTYPGCALPCPAVREHTAGKPDIPAGARSGLDSGTRRGGSVTAAAGTHKLLRQRQAGQAAPARHSGFQHPLLTPEQYRKAKQHVERAIKEKKIFTLLGSHPIIRSQLRARGWVEKKVHYTGRACNRLEQHHGHQEKQLEEEEDDEACPSLETEESLHFPCPPEEEKEWWDEDPDGIHEVMSRMVQKEVPYLIWTCQLSTINSQLLQQNQVVNHYAQVAAFTTKEGLCRNIRNLPWFEQADPDAFFPRCYLLGPADDRQAFIVSCLGLGRDNAPLAEDFRLTAARSLLKMALKRMEQPPKASEEPGTPKPPLASQLVEKALQVCERHLGSLQHQDIDMDPATPGMMDAEWDRFLQDYYNVVHRGAKLAPSEAQRKRCQDLLQLLAQQLPQFGVEGDHNIWILKPGAKSRGIGIVCTGQLEEVLRLSRGCLSGEWVVQKYVERPLLIFNIKFDIRQWFLVTDWNPLTVWFYRDCYLRFCSQHFSLHELDSARHLCNVSIQKWYKLAEDWPPQLPSDQIWSSQQFQEYLAQMGRPDVWDQVTVPGMKAAVLGALRSAKDMVPSQKGSFELYGADFILGEDCQPWLLEINSNPTMAPSAVVTARLCANVQRDMLRVVLNHKDNPTCSTGAFELLYKEAVVPMPMFKGLKLVVQGHSLKKSQLPQDQHQPRASTINLCLPEPPVRSSPWVRATQGLQPGAAQGKPAHLGQCSRRCPPKSAPPVPLAPSACCDGSQGLPQLRHPLRQPQAALPRLPQPNASTLARTPIPPPRETPGNPQRPAGLTSQFSPARVPHPPGCAPGAWTPRPPPGQPSPSVRRQRIAALRGMQNRDPEGHTRDDSSLPAPSRAAGQHPVCVYPRQTRSLGGGTQLPPLRGLQNTLVTKDRTGTARARQGLRQGSRNGRRCSSSLAGGKADRKDPSAPVITPAQQSRGTLDIAVLQRHEQGQATGTGVRLGG